MAYQEKYTLSSELPHTVTLEQRGKLSITGVTDVESFDENAIVVNTSQGVLFVRGNSLHVAKLSLEGGDMVIDGTVDSLEYEDSGRPQGGFFSRMFR